MQINLFFIVSILIFCFGYADASHLILIRHGETLALANKIYHEDSDLNETGEKQALAIVDRLEGIQIDAIYSSPLRRAIRTAEPLAADRSLPITVAEALRERSHGSAEGLPMASFEGTEIHTLYYHPQRDEDLLLRLVPDAENFVESTERFSAALKKIAADHPHQTVVVFCHFGLMKGLLIALTDRFDYPPVLNGSSIELEGDEDGLREFGSSRE